MSLLVTRRQRQITTIRSLKTRSKRGLTLRVLFPRILILFTRLIRVRLTMTTNNRVFGHFSMMFITILLRLDNLKRSNNGLLFHHRIHLIFPLFLLTTRRINTLLRQTSTRRRRLIRVKTMSNRGLRLFNRQSVFVLTRRRRTTIRIRPTRFPISGGTLFARSGSFFPEESPPLDSREQNPTVHLSCPTWHPTPIPPRQNSKANRERISVPR